MYEIFAIGGATETKMIASKNKIYSKDVSPKVNTFM
jgi:hypothetical protein